MPKAIGFVPTEDGVYKEFLGLLKSHDQKQREVFTELMKDYIKVHKNGNPTYTLKPFIEDSEFSAFPAMGSSTENLVKFAQKTSDSMLDDMELQGLRIFLIAKWFKRYDKDEREKRAFTNIRDACKALGVYY
jgi:hypothetical protein